MDFIGGVIFVGVRLAVLSFFGIAIWRLESHPRPHKRPVRQGARLPASPVQQRPPDGGARRRILSKTSGAPGPR